LARPFALQFIPFLRDKVFSTVLDISDEELRTLSKCLVKELLNSMRFVLSRVFSINDVSYQLHRFELDVALVRIRSPIVERQLNGIDFLLEFISRLRSYRSSQRAVEFVNWINENTVLQKAFSSSAHPELMKRAGDIVRFVCMTNSLEIIHLDVIWTALERSLRFQSEAATVVLCASWMFCPSTPDFDASVEFLTFRRSFPPS
jgi:hypothetical protein